ncbi:hypothetical protein PoMZ_04076 [Pyricularia oryzae]|nr:hypothetical protein PoMZ_04076 [Pyricularia oryzae]
MGISQRSSARLVGDCALPSPVQPRTEDDPTGIATKCTERLPSVRLSPLPHTTTPILLIPVESPQRNGPATSMGINHLLEDPCIGLAAAANGRFKDSWDAMTRQTVDLDAEGPFFFIGHGAGSTHLKYMSTESLSPACVKGTAVASVS